MKRIVLTSLLASGYGLIYACEMCKKRQPKPLRGLTHGQGPESDWDYVIIAVMTAFVLLCLYYAVKWLIRPGETEAGHIKHSILLNEDV